MCCLGSFLQPRSQGPLLPVPRSSLSLSWDGKERTQGTRLSFLLQDKFLTLQACAYEELNIQFTANMLLTCILYCDAGPGCFIELFASAVCRFLSRTSYLSSHAFLRRRLSFTSRMLYFYLETFLCFLHLSDRAYVSQARCIGLFLLLLVMTPQDLNVAVYALRCPAYAC